MRREPQEAEEEKLAEEKKKSEQAEYDNWKDMFSTDEAGTEEASVGAESQGLLSEFVDYIKKHKVVVLEDLANNFGLRTEERALTPPQPAPPPTLPRSTTHTAPTLHQLPSQPFVLADTVYTTGSNTMSGS